MQYVYNSGMLWEFKGTVDIKSVFHVIYTSLYWRSIVLFSVYINVIYK